MEENQKKMLWYQRNVPLGISGISAVPRHWLLYSNILSVVKMQPGDQEIPIIEKAKVFATKNKDNPLHWWFILGALDWCFYSKSGWTKASYDLNSFISITWDSIHNLYPKAL
jgi:hypothetical protein